MLYAHVCITWAELQLNVNAMWLLFGERWSIALLAQLGLQLFKAKLLWFNDPVFVVQRLCTLRCYTLQYIFMYLRKCFDIGQNTLKGSDRGHLQINACIFVAFCQQWARFVCLLVPKMPSFYSAGPKKRNHFLFQPEVALLTLCPQPPTCSNLGFALQHLTPLWLASRSRLAVASGVKVYELAVCRALTAAWSSRQCATQEVEQNPKQLVNTEKSQHTHQCSSCHFHARRIGCHASKAKSAKKVNFS